MASEYAVTNVMTSRVVSVSPATAIPEVIRLMVDHGVSGVPVVDDGEVVGIVTEADIVSREIELDPPVYGTFLDAVFKLPWDRTDDELRRILSTTAGELMSSPVKTLPSSATVRDAASLMYKERVNPVPVLDDSGRMVGIVSRSDVIRLLTEV